MAWYIVYKGRTGAKSLQQELTDAGIEYYIPTLTKEYLDNDRMQTKVTSPLTNLIFLKAVGDLDSIIQTVNSLKGPYMDHATGKQAIVHDEEMERFKKMLEYKNLGVQMLQDPYSRFCVNQKVRVRGGDFEGLEGRVIRIKGDRKLIISLGEMALVISGIHHSLLMPIED